MLRDMVVMDWVVSLSMAAAVMWLFDRRQIFGVMAVAVGSVAMAALALVVGGLAFFSLRAFGAVVGAVVFGIAWEVGKAVYAKMGR
jgi:hypothetical protein